MGSALRTVALLLFCTAVLPLPVIAEDDKTPRSAADAIDAGGEYVSVDACAECHDDYVEQISHRKRGQAADRRTPFAAQGCETCHGPGETHIVNISEGETAIGDLISYTGEYKASVEVQNDTCLQCHKSGTMMHWQASVHQRENLACTDCHVVHRPSEVLERTTQIDVCNQCHKKIRAQTYRASTHPIQAAKTVCSDCHNAHGSVGPAELKQLTINENCYACHAEKRGPFLWEHEPASEDCSLCHRAHGSNHPALLTRQGAQLCQTCHQDVRTDGRTHIRNFYDFDLNDPPGGAAGGTARGRFIVGMNCLNCHAQVHGSNHPSGVNLMR